MNPDCALKSLDLLAACLAASRTSSEWGAIAGQCAEIGKYARLAIECASAPDPDETPRWFLDFECIGPDSSERAARVAILTQRGIAAVQSLECATNSEPAAMSIVLSASILFRVLSAKPESLAAPVKEETKTLLATMSKLFEPNPTAHENPDLR